MKRRLNQEYPRHVQKQVSDQTDGKFTDSIHVKTNGDLMNNQNRGVSGRRVSQKPIALESLLSLKKVKSPKTPLERI